MVHMLRYSLDGRGSTPLYEYLYRCIKADIVSGKLKEGEKLPSKRRLAENLSVSVITVENAYAELLAEGYLYSVEKSGYYVSSLETPPVSSAPAGDFALPKAQDFSVDLRTDSLDREKFPTALWCRLSRKVMSEKQEELFHPCPSSGCRELREAIAEYLQRNRALSVSPDCILIGAGTEYLIDMLIRLLGAYRIFGLENPGYRKVAALYASGGVRCFYLDLDEGGVRMDQLRKSPVEVLHISPNHQYPTGLVTTAARRYELLAWAGEREGRYVIEDDYDSELRFASRPCDSMRAEDRGGKVIYMNTFSKTISPSLRIGYLVLPPELMALYCEKFDCFACTVSTFDQLLLAEFIRAGYYERHISRMKKFYRLRRERLFALVQNSTLGNRLKIQEELAGLHFLLRLDTGKPDGGIKREAAQRGIGLSFLSDFLCYPDAAFQHSLVVNYGNVGEEDFARVLQVLEEIL